MCTCELIDWGTQAFSSTTYPRARKPHKCIECRQTIMPGTKYARTSQKWEGSISTHNTCLDCEDWGRAFGAEQYKECGCSGWELGRMWEAIKEFMNERE